MMKKDMQVFMQGQRKELIEIVCNGKHQAQVCRRWIRSGGIPQAT